MTTISACMIVRNESAWIVGAIESVRPAVDEIVIVDTGSTDETAEIALIAGARVERFAWCDDFSAARNSSIDAASGEWVLIVDADHRLGLGAAETIRIAAAQGKSAAYRLPTHEATSPDAPIARVVSGELRRGRPWHPTALMRREVNGERVRYCNPIHEDPMPWLVEHGVVPPALAGANIVHFGGCAMVREKRGSDARNRTALLRWQREQPWNLTPYHYLAQFAFHAGDNAGTLELVNTALAQPVRPTEFGKIGSLLTFGAMAALELKKLDVAQKMLAAASLNDRGTAHPDRVFLEGSLAEAEGRWGDAIAHYAVCTSLDSDAWSMLMLAGATSFSAHQRMAVCFLELGRYDSALTMVDKALAFRGDGNDGVIRAESERLRAAIVKAKAA
jgi:hypothetical protein